MLTTKIKRLGLLGGSFDPVHYGHIKLAIAAKKELKLDKIIFIPVKNPPHKKNNKLAPAYHRVRMLSLALKPYKDFILSLYEIKRKSFTTYTYQTVLYFKSKYPNSNLFLIIGTDSLSEFNTWKNPRIIYSNCQIVTGIRPNNKDNKKIYNSLKFPNIYFLKENMKPISSTEIRQRLKNGLSVKNMLPTSVLNYIKKYGLYN